MVAPTSDTDISAIVRSAERAQAAGQRDEARRLLSQAQSRAPDHPLVLNAAGVQALHRGDPAAAGALPAETTRGTRLRIAEVLDGAVPIATWR